VVSVGEFRWFNYPSIPPRNLICFLQNPTKLRSKFNSSLVYFNVVFTLIYKVTVL
jgi:hypothetical protein